jgi:hypothetical protein
MYRDIEIARGLIRSGVLAEAVKKAAGKNVTRN